MKAQSLNLIYFSPTGNCRRVAHAIGRGIAIAPCKEFDRTMPAGRRIVQHFTWKDLVVIVMPVYGKRLPRVIDGIMAGVSANRTPAVFVVSYGNENYGDALLELKHVATKKGFVGIAAAAISSEHAQTRKVGTSRPDSADLALVEQFGKNVRTKFDTLGMVEMGSKFTIPGVFPYRKPQLDLQMPPTSTASCHTCLTCVTICPMGAVDPKNPQNVDKAKCISCCECVRCCPHGSRVMMHKVILDNNAYMERDCTARREAEFYA